MTRQRNFTPKPHPAYLLLILETKHRHCVCHLTAKVTKLSKQGSTNLPIKMMQGLHSLICVGHGTPIQDEYYICPPTLFISTGHSMLCRLYGTGGKHPVTATCQAVLLLMSLSTHVELSPRQQPCFFSLDVLAQI